MGRAEPERLEIIQHRTADGRPQAKDPKSVCEDLGKTKDNKGGVVNKKIRSGPKSRFILKEFRERNGYKHAIAW